jgi:tetratricopeptide (TPR) repeat protein
VRVEDVSSSLVDSTYTFNPPKFQFRDVRLNDEKSHYLVIREAGFEELRYELPREIFRESGFGRPQKTIVVPFITLELETLSSGKKAEKELKTGPKGVDVRQLQARIPDKARREFDSALEDLAGGKNKAALAHLEKAVKLAPEYYEALNKLGLEYLRSGRFHEAEAILERACAINPNDPLPLLNLGISHFKEGEALAPAAAGKADGGSRPDEESYRKAVEVLEKALSLDPRSTDASFHLGLALYKTGAYERAELLLLNTLALDGGRHEARLALLNIYNRQRRYKEALQQISAYLEANPDSSRREQLMALKIQIESALSR